MGCYQSKGYKQKISNKAMRIEALGQLNQKLKESINQMNKQSP